MTEKSYVYRDTSEERQYESTHFNPEKAHARAKEVLDESEIKLKTFEGLYDPAMLERDAEKVRRAEASFDQTPSQVHADILEAIVCEHGELSEWFGPSSQVIKTARFDDIMNKIDMVVETRTEDQQFSHLALGLDVTFGSRELAKKFDGIRNKIDNGTLGEIKYFHSDRQNYTGRKGKIPQVVIGVEIERIQELGLLWMNRRNKELATHAVQITILEEIVMQLKTFLQYATSKDKSGVIPVLELELQKINELLEQKRGRGLRGIKNDKVFEEIKRNLVYFNKSDAAVSV